MTREVPAFNAAGWALESAEERARDHRDSFELPSRASREALEAGNAAKVLAWFSDHGAPACERVWVVVASRVGSEYTGRLDSQPCSSAATLNRGALISFGAEHIIEVSDGPGVEYLAELAVVAERLPGFPAAAVGRHAEPGVDVLVLAEHEYSDQWLEVQSNDDEDGPYCLVVNGGATHYGGIRSWRIRDGALDVALTEEAAAALGVPTRFAIDIVDLDDVPAVRDAMTDIVGRVD